jgi:RNA polymerase sigma-70 factor (ECF subfamily)
MASVDFENLIKRVYDGDATAASELVRNYEPEIRRIIRFKMRDPSLRRVIDSTDICQSVFAKFFFRASLGQFELKSPPELIGLLARMATNRVIDRYRTEQSQRRLVRTRSGDLMVGDNGQQIDRGQLPENEVEYNELLVKVRQRLSGEELQISKLRSSGKSWLEVAEKLGSSPQALRKKLERACDRIFGEMGIAEA